MLTIPRGAVLFLAMSAAFSLNPAHAEVTSYTEPSDLCIDRGIDPSCILQPCGHVWRYVVSGVVVAEEVCPPGYSGWGYPHITIGGSYFDIHCCAEGFTGHHTYHFLDDKITIVFTTTSCKIIT